MYMFLLNLLYTCTSFFFRVEGLFFGGYDNDKVRFRVFSTGMVRWIMPLPLTTTCDVDIAKFPFDSQSCHIDIVFWGFNTIDLAPNITTEVRKKCEHQGSFVQN